MAINAGPDMIEDGLVLCLDAANINSYPKSGTTWSDLAGSNNGTLTNGPTFSGDNGGSLVFDGTDDYVELSSLSTSLFSDGNASLFCFLKSYTSSANYSLDSGIFGFGSNGSNNHYTWSDGRAYLDTFRTSRVSTSSSIIGGSVDKGKPHAICITTKNGGNWNFYQIQNENLVLQHSTSAGTFGMSDSQKKIGYSNSPAYIFRGSFYNFLMYNKELSIGEIRQNYEATVGRYT